MATEYLTPGQWASLYAQREAREKADNDDVKLGDSKLDDGADVPAFLDGSGAFDTSDTHFIQEVNASMEEKFRRRRKEEEREVNTFRCAGGRCCVQGVCVCARRAHCAYAAECGGLWPPQKPLR